MLFYLFIAALCLYLVFKLLTRPEVDRKGIVKNYIQVLVDADKTMNSSDKIVLMKKQLDLLKLEEIPPWQREEFVKAVLLKLGK
jgi:hypothetical protein